ncbi:MULTISPECIES: hypothetical protein [unclassified Streptomyces]|uniref:hypothetical protein n=1 Tax=unclassified Streptomyces TaxID=2593676 RepID=UPI000DAEDF20|nr:MULTISPECIES: hypothetical protein [unclassified Streptomyces]PZT73854.1 hypothetical protein DNK55_16820 [Streptomyces sp. AC1-42T]PZT83152.1 hypothetical protein DNK56_14615 [Streptomyces sp. AC1-42W]
MSDDTDLTEELLDGLSPEAVEQARAAMARREGPANVETCDYCRSVSRTMFQALADGMGFEEQVEVAYFHIHNAHLDPDTEGPAT